MRHRFLGDAGTARFKELDGLRGIAALLVVGSHFLGGYEFKYPSDPHWSVDMRWGAYGVPLFFLISGFVILMSTTRVERPSDFLISRVARLYPVYWLTLLQSVVVVHLAHMPQAVFPWYVLLGNITMVQRLLLLPNVDEVYWTLALEMQFYALIFLLLLFTRCRLSPRVVVVVGTAWIAVSMVAGVALGPCTRGVDPQLVWTPVKIIQNLLLVEWGPLFVTGMFAYLARSARGVGRRRLWLLTIAAGLAALAVHLVVRGWQDWYWIAGVIAAFFVVVMRRRTRVLMLRPVQWLGRVSYSLYIGHAVLGIAVIHALVPVVGREGATAAALVVVLLNAAVLNRLGERRGTAILRGILVRVRARLSPQPCGGGTGGLAPEKGETS